MTVSACLGQRPDGAAPRPAPDQRDRRRHRRQRGSKIRDGIAAARERGAQLVALPRAGDHRLPARGPAAQGALPAPTRAPRSSGSPPTPQGIVALVGFPERADDVYNAAAVLADGARPGHLPQDAPAQLRRLRRDALLPGRRRAARVIEVDGVTVGLTICEDIWVPGPPATDEALAGAELDRQPVGLALPRAARAPSASGCSPSARATTSCAVAFCDAGRRPGRARLRRPLASSIDHDGRGHRPRAAVRRATCWSPTSTPQRRARRRACATRASAPAARARPRAGVARARRASTPRARPRRDAPRRRRVADLLDAEAEVYAALVLGTRDYVEQERLRARRARPVGRRSTRRWWRSIAVDALGPDARDRA